MPSLSDLKLHSSGKVREIYEWDGDLLMVASDRISVYDVVMPTPIPDKGKVLTGMSVFWFGLTEDIVPNHFISEDVPEEVSGRAMRVRRLEMYPVECVVRGYLSGSGWKEYREGGAVCGIELPPGLVESDKLPEPIFTPATKAALGDHDENIDFDTAVELLGGEMAEQVREVSLRMYSEAAARAEQAGFLLADTKFELGLVPDGEGGKRLVVADELLTPDSSRFWRASDWHPGSTPQGFDKQPVRDFLESLMWDKRPPAPPLPVDVVAATAGRYREAYEAICGRSLDAWPGATVGGSAP